MKGLFSILFWFLDIANQYDQKKRSYLRMGYVRKFLRFLLHLGLTILGIWLLFLAATMLVTKTSGSQEMGMAFMRFIGGLLLMIISITLILAMMSESFLGALVAFRVAREAKNAPPKETDENGEEIVVIDNDEQAKLAVSNSNRFIANKNKTITSATAQGYDILMGVFYSLLFVVLCAGTVLAFVFGLAK